MDAWLIVNVEVMIYLNHLQYQSKRPSTKENTIEMICRDLPPSTHMFCFACTPCVCCAFVHDDSLTNSQILPPGYVCWFKIMWTLNGRALSRENWGGFFELLGDRVRRGVWLSQRTHPVSALGPKWQPEAWHVRL